MSNAVDPLRKHVIQELECPHMQALLDAIQSAIALRLAFDAKLIKYDKTPGGELYPRFVVTIYASQLTLAGIDDV